MTTPKRSPKKVGALTIEALTDRTQYLKMLVYGESGVGKTVLASTAPRPILWLEAEGGTHSIADRRDIDITRVVGLSTYREAVHYLAEHPDAYRSVVIDSFSETLNSILRAIMAGVVAEDPSRDEWDPRGPEWNRLTVVMREIARAFRDLPLNVVLTALTREDTDKLTGRVRVRPKLTPALCDDVISYMDVVGYYYSASKTGEVGAKGVEGGAEDEPTVIRNLLLRPTGKYAAKARVPMGMAYPDFLTAPTVARIAEVIGLTL